MFLQQRAASSSTGISASDYVTAKDDLELNLIELIKAQRSGGPPSAHVAEEKMPEPADAEGASPDLIVDEEGVDYEAIEAAHAAAQAALEEEEAARKAAEDAARADAEAEEAAAAAREAAEADARAEAEAAAAAAAVSAIIDDEPSDFGDDW
jgi:coatomer subunit beta'